MYTESLFEFSNEHNHISDESTEIRSYYYDKMKDLCAETELPKRQIVHSVLRGAPEQVIHAMGDFETIYRTLTNIRERAFNPVPYINETLGLSATLSRTHLQTGFIEYVP